MQTQIVVKYFLSCLYLYLIVRSGSALVLEFTAFNFQKFIFYGIFLWASLSIRDLTTLRLNPRIFFVTITHFTFPVFFDFNINSFSSLEIEVTCQILFSCGIAISTFAMLDLGKSFALFPGHSKLVHLGLYKFVRHPIYLGYVFLIMSIVIANSSPRNWALAVVFLILTDVRIKMEEAAMLEEKSYLSYKSNVPYRLFPWIY